MHLYPGTLIPLGTNYEAVDQILNQLPAETRSDQSSPGGL